MHLAVGWGVGQLKVGSFARGERMAKWNEALRVEEALGARGGRSPAAACCSGRVAQAMKVLFHYAAGPDLAARLAAVPGLTIVDLSGGRRARALQRLLPRDRRAVARAAAAAPPR